MKKCERNDAESQGDCVFCLLLMTDALCESSNGPYNGKYTSLLPALVFSNPLSFIQPIMGPARFFYSGKHSWPQESAWAACWDAVFAITTEASAVVPPWVNNGCYKCHLLMPAQRMCITVTCNNVIFLPVNAMWPSTRIYIHLWVVKYCEISHKCPTRQK